MYVCKRDSLSILKFESLDIDAMDRSVQPVYLKQQGTSMKNEVNSMMDHVWDGFYSGQLRKARFPVIVDAFKESIYDITYSATPPKKQRFKLVGEKADTGILLRIAFPDSNAYQISVGGKRIGYNNWNDEIKYYDPITKLTCGENRYIATENVMEFYLTNGCEVVLEPRNVIMTKVRMEWSLKDFYNNGGATKLVDRISASLGIRADQIKVVAVYEGSLVVNYHIVSLIADAVALAVVEQKQKDLMASNSFELGAPVLDFEANSATVVADGKVTASGYAPIIITKTPTNQATNADGTI